MKDFMRFAGIFRLAALASLFEYLCEKNAVTYNPVKEEALLNALALCEKEGVANLWVDDPLGFFPRDARPTRERR